jgi:hypothetical protein
MRVAALWLERREARVTALRAARSFRARRQLRDARGRFLSRQRQLAWAEQEAA